MTASIDPARTTFRIVHNPQSGHASKNAQTRAFAAQFFRDKGVQTEFAETQSSGHATVLAQQAVDEGCDVIVAMGGDGTMNEVAQAVNHSAAVFGLIPCGSGNGLGRHLGLHGPLQQSLEALLSGRIRLIDTGRANQQPFFNVMGVGFDADLSGHFNRLQSRGLWPYLRTGINLWRRYQPATYTIQFGNQTTTLSALMIAVANSDQYGYNCFISPGSKVDDGQLNLTVVKPVSLLGFAALAYRLRRGSAAKSPYLKLLCSDHFTIEREQAGSLHTDGEVHQTTARVEVTVQPASLRILVPANR